MKYRHSRWLLCGVVVFSWLGSEPAQVFGQARVIIPNRGFYYTPGGPFLANPGMPSTSWNSWGYQPTMTTYNPYIAPYPAYGIMPPPFITAQQNYYSDPDPRDQYRYRTTRPDYYGDPSDYPNRPARKRSSLYPAVPMLASTEQSTPTNDDPRRVRIIVQVPKADAKVWINGAVTQQPGMTRTFITPPLEYDRAYTMRVKIEWTDESGQPRTVDQPYPNTIIGDTIRYPSK